MNRKQEAEICLFCEDPTGFAGRGEDSLYLDDIGPFCSRCYDIAARFAPLLVREFPEEEVQFQLEWLSQVTEYAGSLGTKPSPDLVIITFKEIKRLWEGQQDKPKDVCQMCGGSKKVSVDNCCSVDCEIPSHRIDCPDCASTGECQHKDIQNVQTDLISLYCDDCKQYVKDRRKSAERRKGA